MLSTHDTQDYTHSDSHTSTGNTYTLSPPGIDMIKTEVFTATTLGALFLAPEFKIKL